MRLTLLRAKEALAKKSPADELEFRLNRACERLLLHGKFAGSLRRIALVAAYGQIALARQFRTIEGVKVDGLVYEIANHWWAFLPGKSDVSSFITDAVVDLGDGWATMTDTPLLGTLSSTVAGVTIYGENAIGTPIELVLADTAEHANPFTTVSRIHKEMGTAPVTVRQTDASAIVTILAIMDPDEEETFYRRYLIEANTNASTSVVEALVKIRHIEFTSDSDILPISNISALSLALDALQAESEQDTALSANYMGQAVDILNMELEDTNAVDTMPMIRFLYPGNTAPNFRSHY